MRDSSFEQGTISEIVGEDRFKEVEVRIRFGILQSGPHYNNAGSLSKLRRASGGETDNGIYSVIGVVDPEFRVLCLRAWLECSSQELTAYWFQPELLCLTFRFRLPAFRLKWSPEKQPVSKPAAP